MSANSQLPGRGGRQHSYLICGSLTNFKEREHMVVTNDTVSANSPINPAIYHWWYHPYAYRDIHTYVTFCNITLKLNKYT